MALRVVAVLACICLTGALGSAVDAGVSEKPVQKVIRLLKEMNTKLEKEAEEDQEIYDAMACWCETNEKAKTKAIADGTQKDKQLTELIPQLAATSAQLKVEIEQLTKEVGQNKEALAEATEIRAKEEGEFRTEETDAVASITGLKNAVGALSKPNAALTQEVLMQVQQAVGSNRQQDVLRRFLKPQERHTVEALLQQGSHRSATHGPSSEIFGVLKGMKESFEQNLANAQKEEADAVATFAELKSTKQREISAATKLIESKTVELANTGEKSEQSKEDLEDTRDQVTADQAFLLDLQERCGSMDKEFADRQKIRSEEMKAVSEALKILADDDAGDLFRKTTLLQTSRVTALSRKERALQVLREAGKNLGLPQLTLLSIRLKDDVFAKIKEVIDDLTKKLEQEQEDDVSQRDLCIDDLNTNEKELASAHSFKDDAATKIEDLSLTIERLGEEIVAAKAEIADTKKEILVASENREKENHEFQVTVTEQRSTQEILNKALDKLKAFYDAAALVQVKTAAATHVASGQAPPPGFGGEYKKSEGATGVMGMIENIIGESKQVEDEAVKGEADAQAAYESFLKDSNKAIDALNKSITDKTEASGKADAEKIRTEEEFKSFEDTITDLEKMSNLLHGQCDFLLKNFEVRQASRTQEIEALAEAKAFMSGAATH